MGRARVLLVEDDDSIRSAVGAALNAAGLQVEAMASGHGLEARLAALRPALVVLDWMLPGRDGPELARVVRSAGDAGIIMLTAREGIEDRLHGFATGVDDYLAKPFVMAELLARSRALLHRLGAVPATVEVGDLVVDEAGGTARRGSTGLSLTATEFRLLVYLAENRGRVLSGTQILTQVWGYDDYSDNLVQTHVSSLRRKMEQHGPRLVHTVRGLGYVLRETAP